jgi:hypothetical protein
MAVSEILATIDKEISTLQEARALLSGNGVPTTKQKPGRPKKAASVTSVAAKATKVTKKRVISPEGRKRIAEAVKRRWAAQKSS